MPARLHLATSPTQIGDLFGVITMDPSLRLWQPRYNIAPGRDTLVIRMIEGVSAEVPVPRGMVGKPLAGTACELTIARWGLVKPWAASPEIGIALTESGVDTLDRQPDLWTLLERRRCLVALDGFYEWKRAAPTDPREPQWVGVVDPATRSTGPFLVAGVWDRWSPEVVSTAGGAAGGAAPLDTFAILTRDASGALAEVFDRVPVVVPNASASAWLLGMGPASADGKTNHAEASRSACQSVSEPNWSWYAVSPLVNSPRHDDPRCLEPAARLALPGFGEG
jgi:putative SOS response-associated peptidase YedK